MTRVIPMILEKSSLEQRGTNLILHGTGRFDLDATLDCGQAFRWKKGGDEKWRGIVGRHALCVWQHGDSVVFENTSAEQFRTVWQPYFDWERDYDTINKVLSCHPVLSEIVAFSGGIHILRQEPWEALCSFILSQNNNIPRIKGIIDRLCQQFGSPIEGGYTFPTAHDLAKRTVGDLSPIRCGFRAKYVLDAAEKVSDGRINLSALPSMPLDRALECMQTVNGVGPKVANCALLYGCGRIDCFPVDVWIRRAMDILFDGKLPAVAEPYAGIVQQYIFHYARMTKLNI